MPVYLHSPRRDFASTRLLPEHAYLGRKVRPSALKLCDCGCPRPVLERIGRRRWMRFLPFVRHYLCRMCGDRVLRPKIAQRSPYAAVYIAAASRGTDWGSRLRDSCTALAQRALG